MWPGAAGAGGGRRVTGRRPTAKGELFFWCAAALGLGAVLFLRLFPVPADFADRFLGDARYGAYQETLWWYTHLARNLLEPGAWFHSPLQKYPFGIAPHELYANDFLVALLHAPLLYLPSLVLSTNLFVLLMLVANGVACGLALRSLGTDRWIALAAGGLFAWNPYVVLQIREGRLSLVLLATLPLFVAAWWRAANEGGARSLVLAGVLLVLTFLVYPYYGVFLAGLALFLVPLRGGAWKRSGKQLALLLGGSGLALLPVMYPLLAAWPDLVDHGDGCRVYGIAVGTLPANFSAVFQHSLGLNEWEQILCPTVVALVAGFGFRGLPRRLALVGLGASILALGPYFVADTAAGQRACRAAQPLPWWLFYHLVPGAEAFSHPRRFLVLTHLCGAGVVALGLHRFARNRLRGPLRAAALALFVAWLPLLCAPPRTEPPRVPVAFGAIGDGQAPLLLLPLQASDYLLYPQIYHLRPLFNGDGLMVENKNPPELNALLRENSLLRYLVSATRRFPPGIEIRDADVAWFRERGFRHVVLCSYIFTHPEVQRLVNGRSSSGRRSVNASRLAERTRQRLQQALGPPEYADEDVVVFRLPDPAAEAPLPSLEIGGGVPDEVGDGGVSPSR